MFSIHNPQHSQESLANATSNLEPATDYVAAATMSLRSHARTLVLATMLAAAISTSAFAVRFAGAEPVNQTGPNGAQCHLKSMGGDIVDPSNSDTTNSSNSALSPSTGSPDGLGPQMAVAGCDLKVLPPPPPPPTPTPTSVPTHGRVLQNAAGFKQLS